MSAESPYPKETMGRRPKSARARRNVLQVIGIALAVPALLLLCAPLLAG